MAGKWKQAFMDELDKWKGMVWKDRLWYLWTYYKVHAALLACAVLIIAFLGNIVYRQTFTDQLYCVIVNGPDSDASGGQALADGYHQYMGYGKKDLVTVDSSIRLDFESPESPVNYASVAKISALFMSNDLDILIGDSQTIEHYAGQQAWADLSQALPRDLYEQWEPFFIYAQGEDKTSYPCAVSLSWLPDAKKRGFPQSSPLLAISSNTKRMDNSLALLRYLGSRSAP